jgi:mannose-1-phosphate guanylyltransferase
MINILLCGGSGTRLWPLSRKFNPKQFNKLFNNQSLFQNTLERNLEFCQQVRIISAQDQYFLAQDQVIEISPDENEIDYILEPIGRDTAPALALGLKNLSEDAIILVTPSDHFVRNKAEYKKVCIAAKVLAEAGAIVTFGITPHYPETGYGYINHQGQDVIEFVEKPDLEKAKEYLKSGNYLWNSGMFCFKVSTFLGELKKFRPDIHKQVQETSFATQGNVHKIKKEDMLKIPKDSIDYAIMEKSKLIKVVQANIDWSDVGSFDALYSELDKDVNGNTLNDQHYNINSKNNLILSHKLVSTIDIEDLNIIDTEDALLITKRGSSQKVKEIYQKVEAATPNLTQVHTTVFKPWGSYTILADEAQFKVKSITVKPGAELSLQKHRHSHEHWVVAKGQAIIINGENKFTLNVNESTSIKAGDQHRLTNNTDQEIIVIETRVGSYIGEDDITRIEDKYSRD